MNIERLFHKEQSEIGATGRLKTYPDGSRELLVCDRPIFKDSGWERAGWRESPAKTPKKPSGDDVPPGLASDNSTRAMRRARAEVRDLALCTPFRYFVTLTLDRAKIDRYDMPTITRRLNTWLDNRVRRRGLAYVLVPERHKDGAIHFHGFFNDALPVVDSGHCDKAGHTVYNLPAWDFGFTTAIALYGDYHHAVSYVCKYIGKQGEKIGGRWYYSGGALGRPEVDYVDVSLRDVEAAEGAYRFDVPDAALSFALLRLPPVEQSNECSSAAARNLGEGVSLQFSESQANAERPGGGGIDGGEAAGVDKKKGGNNWK